MSGIKQVESAEAARALAGFLNSTSRTIPIAVVSVPAGRDAPYIDVVELHDQVGDLLPIYVIPTGDVSWAFSEEMASQTQVYGGAGRVYPAGVEWVIDPYKSPLRFAFNEAEGKRSTEALIGDAFRLAVAAGLVASTTPAKARSVTGRVVGITAGRAIVRLGSGQFASIVGELAVPGMALELIVAPDLTVTGTLDSAGRLDVRGMVRPADEIPYRAGDIVLAKVKRVDAGSAELALHPDLAVDVRREAVTTNALDDLTTLMTEGEVLRARVVSTAPWALILRDLDDDEEAVQAFAIVPGGPPWVVEGVPVVEPVEEVEPPKPTLAEVPPPAPEVAPVLRPRPPTPAIFDRSRQATPSSPVSKPALKPVGPTPVTVPSANSALARQQGEVERLAEELRRAKAEVGALRGEHRLLLDERTKSANRVVHLEGELAGARQKLRVARSRPASEASDESTWFSDPNEQFRHEVYVAWACRISPYDKQDRPLRAYTLGRHFLDSVASLEGIKRSKIVDVVVEVLTGIADEQASREMHPLRTSGAGDAPQRVRDDGAKAWRVSLQVNTPSARRLHFWRCPDGTFELSKVAVHDDFSA